MTLLDKLMPERQKRMKVAIGAMVINYILFTIGIFQGTNLTELGSGLSLVNIPIMTWLLGESIRPTRKIETELEYENS